jgi:hypothetical protein
LEAILPDAAGAGAARNRPGGSILAAGNRNGAEPRRNIVPIPRDLTNYNYGVVGWSNGQ